MNLCPSYPISLENTTSKRHLKMIDKDQNVKIVYETLWTFSRESRNDQCCRKSATSNPFVVYDFYDLLEELMQEHQFEPDQIWNCDETGFPTDPQRYRVVSSKGESAYEITCGTGKENITTLTLCSAAGDVLEPVVIFPGKNFKSTWKGVKALPETCYGLSDNGGLVMSSIGSNCW